MKGPRRNDIPPPPTWARPREEWVWDGESWLWIPPTKADVAYLFKGEGRLSPRRCAEIIARGGEAAEECYRQLGLRREVETTTAQESQEQAFAPYPDDNSTAETRDISYPYLVRVAAAISGKPEWHNDTLTILRTLDEEHYNRIMDQAAMACKPAADYYGLPVEKVQRTLEALRAAERETTSRSATAEPRPEAAATETTKRKRGPRVKPNPALPATAPEIYRDRKPREELNGKKENIVQFIERVYAPWREILTRPDLRRLDTTADEGVGNWISYHKQPFPNGLLPTEFELNTAKRIAKPSRRSAARMGIPHRNIFTPFR